MFYGVVLAGGRGERFWPAARKDRPKQLLAANGRRSMLVETVTRVESLVPPRKVIVVGTGPSETTIRAELQGLNVGMILSEPRGRNTAVAIGLAAAYLDKLDPRATMFVLPADHHIEAQDRFLNVLEAAARLAMESDALVTVGITPTWPSTRYGYVEMADQVPASGDVLAFRVQDFKEKPNLSTARSFVADGHHLWNSGMYVWRTNVILDAISTHMPELGGWLEKLRDTIGEPGERDLVCRMYDEIENVSIDCGVMEKADNAMVVKGNFVWEDIGDWDSLRAIRPRDESGNVTVGTALPLDSGNCVLCSTGDSVVAVMGVKDLVVVHSGNATLVCPRNLADKVTELVRALEERDLAQFL
jgi:mannose-1-phosphate guanylyltransferase